MKDFNTYIGKEFTDNSFPLHLKKWKLLKVNEEEITLNCNEHFRRVFKNEVSELQFILSRLEKNNH